MYRRMLSLLCALVMCLLPVCQPACGTEETQSSECTVQTADAEVYTVDFFKISPMISEHADPAVCAAAISVIEAFLNYETSVRISSEGNTSSFLNDLGYVLNCTCPPLTALTDLNKLSLYNTPSYDRATGTIHWNYHLSEDEFRAAMDKFTARMNEQLSSVRRSDSDAMKALLLYMGLTENAVYDYELLNGDAAALGEAEYDLRSSSYYTLLEKHGICYNFSQAFLFLCTQADVECGTVLHFGGEQAHMWNILCMDGEYYYCDVTWDISDVPRHFGINALDRASWAGGYDAQEGSMLGTILPAAYAIDGERFAQLRMKVPREITAIEIDREKQILTFFGYDYQFSFECTP